MAPHIGRPDDPVTRDGSPGGWRTVWDAQARPTDWYRTEAAEFVRRLERVVPLRPDMDLLEFGSGFGLVAGLLAPRVRTLYVWDSSPTMRRHTASALAGAGNVRVLDLADPSRSPEGVLIHLVLVNSVVQYMTADEVPVRLASLGRLLRPTGRMVVSDIIIPGHAPYRELLGLVWSRGGQILRGLRGSGLRHNARRYLFARRRLLHLGREDLERIAESAGLRVEFLPENLTHFRGRLTAVFRR